MPGECSAQDLTHQTLQSRIYNPLLYRQQVAGRAETVSQTSSPSVDHHADSSRIPAFFPFKAVVRMEHNGCKPPKDDCDGVSIGPAW